MQAYAHILNTSLRCTYIFILNTIQAKVQKTSFKKRVSKMSVPQAAVQTFRSLQQHNHPSPSSSTSLHCLCLSNFLSQCFRCLCDSTPKEIAKTAFLVLNTVFTHCLLWHTSRFVCLCGSVAIFMGNVPWESVFSSSQTDK